MIVNYRKHSKKITTTAIVMLIVTGFIFFTLTGFAKEEQSNIPTPREINRPTPYNTKKGDPVIIIRVTKEGEIWIENQQFDIGSIGSKMERFKKEYPEGNVVIYGNKEAPLGIAIGAYDEVRATGIKNVFISMAKD